MKNATEIRRLIDEDIKRKIEADFQNIVPVIKATVNNMYNQETTKMHFPFIPSYEKFFDSEFFREYIRGTGFWIGKRDSDIIIVIHKESDNKKFGYSSNDITNKIRVTKEQIESRCKTWLIEQLEVYTEEMAEKLMSESTPIEIPFEFMNCTDLISTILKNEYDFQSEISKGNLVIKI